MGGFVNAVLGDGESTTNVTTAAPSKEELELIKLSTKLAQSQLDNINALAPFQQELVKQSMADLQRTGAYNTAYDAALSPEDQAKFAADDARRAQKYGPIQDELLQLQLDTARRGGAATPQQLAQIKEAADAGIAAGTSDIDASTGRGIGLIADELANSRGLRLSDSPIKGEAALLAREGEIQKGSLIKNLRAGEAQARLNFPLAASQISSGINLSTASVADATKAFQAELRQRAYQNRLALSGQTSSTGIGLSNVGAGAGASALGSLSGVRSHNYSGTSFDPAALMTAYGKLGGGIGSVMAG